MLSFDQGGGINKEACDAVSFSMIANDIASFFISFVGWMERSVTQQ